MRDRSFYGIFEDKVWISWYFKQFMDSYKYQIALLAAWEPGKMISQILVVPENCNFVGDMTRFWSIEKRVICNRYNTNPADFHGPLFCGAKNWKECEACYQYC